MATGPGDELEAAGHRHLRASHADREQVIGTLKTAFVQGRLAKDELDVRAGQAFTARTDAELAALTADLPAGLADAVPPRRAVRAQARRPMSNTARASIWAVIAVAALVVLSFSIGGAAFLVFTPLHVMALAVLGAQTLIWWQEKRSHRGQLPPGPARGQRVKSGPSGRRMRSACAASGHAAHSPGFCACDEDGADQDSYDCGCCFRT
jgi:hypothetical protein